MNFLLLRLIRRKNKQLNKNQLPMMIGAKV